MRVAARCCTVWHIQLLAACSRWCRTAFFHPDAIIWTVLTFLNHTHLRPLSVNMSRFELIDQRFRR